MKLFVGVLNVREPTLLCLSPVECTPLPPGLPIRPTYDSRNVSWSVFGGVQRPSRVLAAGEREGQKVPAPVLDGRVVDVVVAERASHVGVAHSRTPIHPTTLLPSLAVVQLGGKSVKDTRSGTHPWVSEVGSPRRTVRSVLPS